MAELPAELPATFPFSNVKLSSWDPLRNVKNRMACPSCGKSRKFYCYSCCKLVNLKSTDIPCVQLPVKIDIVKHYLEVDGKSTAIQAKILAPNDVTLFKYPMEVPYYEDSSRVVLAYPQDTSMSCEELVEKLKKLPPHSSEMTATSEKNTVSDVNNWNLVHRLVFIDSTWQQTHQILMHENIKNLQAVQVTEFKTCFWRYQRKGVSHLATIESIFYILKELDSLLSSRSYDGKFDNILYFYIYQYNLINSLK